jgi:hypothetical protein
MTRTRHKTLFRVRNARILAPQPFR